MAARIVGHQKSIQTITVSSDGKIVWSADLNGLIRGWDADVYYLFKHYLFNLCFFNERYFRLANSKEKFNLICTTFLLSPQFNLRCGFPPKRWPSTTARYLKKQMKLFSYQSNPSSYRQENSSKLSHLSQPSPSSSLEIRCGALDNKAFKYMTQRNWIRFTQSQRKVISTVLFEPRRRLTFDSKAKCSLPSPISETLFGEEPIKVRLLFGTQAM